MIPLISFFCKKDNLKNLLLQAPLKEKNIYFYTLERFDPRVKAWDKTAVLGTVLTLENLFEEFHRERFGDNKYVIEYLNQKERKIND